MAEYHRVVQSVRCLARPLRPVPRHETLSVPDESGRAGAHIPWSVVRYRWGLANRLMQITGRPFCLVYPKLVDEELSVCAYVHGFMVHPCTGVEASYKFPWMYKGAYRAWHHPDTRSRRLAHFRSAQRRALPRRGPGRRRRQYLGADTSHPWMRPVGVLL